MAEVAEARRLIDNLLGKSTESADSEDMFRLMNDSGEKSFADFYLRNCAALRERRQQHQPHSAFLKSVNPAAKKPK